RRLQLRAHLLRLAELLQRPVQGLLLRQPRRLVLGHGVQQVPAQLLPDVLAKRPRAAYASADLAEVVLKLVHWTSPGCGGRRGTARPRTAPSPGAPAGPCR